MLNYSVAELRLNKKLNFNKSVSYVRLRVGRVNIFIKFSRYWYYLLADKYELSARLLLYTGYTSEYGQGLIFIENKT